MLGGKRRDGREAGRKGSEQAGRQGRREEGKRRGREAGRQGGRHGSREAGRKGSRQAGREEGKTGREGTREAGRQGSRETGIETWPARSSARILRQPGRETRLKPMQPGAWWAPPASPRAAAGTLAVPADPHK